MKNNFKEIEKNTFYLLKLKTYRHFFTKKELELFFRGFKVILLKQKKILDTGHDKPHFHNIIELVAEKKRQ